MADYMLVFTCMLQVFFTVFSVYLWQNYSTTYRSGMYTTSSVSFSGLVCTQFIYTECFLKQGGKNRENSVCVTDVFQSREDTKLERYKDHIVAPLS